MSVKPKSYSNLKKGIPFTNISLQKMTFLTMKLDEKKSNSKNNICIKIINDFQIILPTTLKMQLENVGIKVLKQHIASYIAFKLLQNIKTPQYEHLLVYFLTKYAKKQL